MMLNNLPLFTLKNSRCHFLKFLLEKFFLLYRLAGSWLNYGNTARENSSLLIYNSLLLFPSEISVFNIVLLWQACFVSFRYLCLQNKSTANTCFETYTQKHPSIHSGPPFTLPLLNFLWLLQIALEGWVKKIPTCLLAQLH